ncbi:glucose-6-phosphate dehydrogenase [Desulfobacterota bacterium AH_259_B03_O07]|nr:glucose-6-phosphate dehydrogenase [Desulfobacterota bacterium AH_259_B03_O07]
MEIPENCVVVIFGASGDLTKRKLVPALYALYLQNALPKKFAVLGVSRSLISDKDFQKRIVDDIRTYSSKKPINREKLKEFSKNFFYQSLDATNEDEYEILKKRLSELSKRAKSKENYLYYLSTSPTLFPMIAENLGKKGLQTENNRTGWKRIIVEKPFGRDLKSAQALNSRLQSYFQEDQIYRIDHYLGKETVQNIMAFRFANGIIEPLWNRNFISRVEVTAAESIGVEERGGYYDHYGVLRDMVQNHLLQVVGTIAMEPPAFFTATAVRNETVKVFQSLKPIKTSEVRKYVVRGQYNASKIRGKEVSGYREEKDVDPKSKTPTFVALKIFIDNFRWGDVPFYIRSGKRLPTRVTEVVIYFKKTPHHLFTGNGHPNIGCNQLIIRIQPDEGTLLKFGMKTPGAGFKIEDVSMDFHYSELYHAYIPEAYERLILDCMFGDATLYARIDAVEACWKFVDPILDAWQNRSNIKIYGYPAGTWGPKESLALFDYPDEDWRYPCKNLATEGEYCEL